MARKTTIINFSAPHDLAKIISRQAIKEKISKSELLRAAFSAYLFDQELKNVQKLGKGIAENLGLETYDDIEKYCR